MVNPFSSLTTMPPGKVIKPPLECSILYNGPPGCDNFPKSPLFMKNQADVFACFVEISTEPGHAPSIRANAIKLAPESTIQMFIDRPNSLAFTFAAFMAVSACANVKFIFHILFKKYCSKIGCCCQSILIYALQLQASQGHSIDHYHISVLHVQVLLPFLRMFF